MLFLKSKKRQLILNVSDLWPIAGLELGAFKKNFSYKMLERIEFYNYKHADMILGQSDEILSHIETIVPNKNCIYIEIILILKLKTTTSINHLKER